MMRDRRIVDRLARPPANRKISAAQARAASASAARIRTTTTAVV
jgi:hypothetical protein